MRRLTTTLIQCDISLQSWHPFIIAPLCGPVSYSSEILASLVFQDDEIPKDGRYDVDGSYVPKIVFLGNIKMLHSSHIKIQL